MLPRTPYIKPSFKLILECAGLRADVVQALADLKPGFVRFPGGCVVEGTSIATAYRWKDTVGDISERKQNRNFWANRESPEYNQTYGLGFYEYFQFCEDIGAAAVPVINCGMTCQYNRGGNVPMDQLGPWVQDALDLVEFANGPVTSTWGGVRARMGHPEPFDMRYLAIGNEQWGPEYFERYAVFQRALSKAHPEIQLISTAGPRANGPDWDYAWKQFRSGTPAAIVDEHYYVPLPWLLANVDRYADYDRAGPKVFVGEFAAHRPDRRSAFDAALAEAAYMSGLLRHADVVAMASYAPLLAKAGRTQWEPDLIWFDNQRVLRTASYHVQALYSQNRPNRVLPTRVETTQAPAVATNGGRIGVGTWDTAAEFKDVVVTAADGQELYRSEFSQGLAGWGTPQGSWVAEGGALRQCGLRRGRYVARLHAALEGAQAGGAGRFYGVFRYRGTGYRALDIGGLE
jgi:alpha-L-arabinofuranosidase